jgi:alkanesulfonate monooxygenase SsuD/methylene tetrahydromethanopterin reductase-like flavin-dependent oxidoreductase (luciferase family)
VAEDAASVDLISGGRLDLGVGPGWDLNEFESLGVPIKQRRPRMHEGLEALRRLFTEERVTHNGKYYQFSNVALAPKPLQKPHPPLWVAAVGEEATRQAARLGYNLMGAGSEHGQKVYDEALREAGRNPDAYKIAQLRIAYVAKTRKQAWDEAEPHVHYGLNYFYTRFKAMADRFTQQATLPEVPPVGKLRDTPGLSFFGARVTVGTPDEVTEEILRYKENTRITHMVLMELPGIAADKNNRNLELFAKEVMPHIR